ncbi:hypothetical protein [Gilliamella sp. ESL0250]|uniref:hypothetical protein n=1 Tax=Gilliamella sp. ESL0250 TaxID=2705036 RepID=UPI001580FF4E|nr:hypothetical protein [Gilliamella sp. ESL0250]NUF50331.1 hypothetical protein [Gilliamella sp. ESL0250]
MKLPKLNGLLSMKKDIKTVSQIKDNIQRDLDIIRNRITSLANEWDKIFFQPLNKTDALKKDLLAIDNLHLALKDNLKSNILERHNSVFANPRKDQYYINGAYEILLSDKQASEYHIAVIANFFKSPYQTLALFNVNEAKRIVTEVYDSISDHDWQVKNASDMEKSAIRLKEIQAEQNELKQLEQNILVEAQENNINVQ